MLLNVFGFDDISTTSTFERSVLNFLPEKFDSKAKKKCQYFLAPLCIKLSVACETSSLTSSGVLSDVLNQSICFIVSVGS